MNRISSLLLCVVLCSSLSVTQVTVPSWARDAVWYQIFPERFRNGDSTNDPTPAELEIPAGREWHVSPWTSDWYRLQPWEQAQSPKFYQNVFDRRYGGDLQGVIDKLDYLKSLGITAIYFNPLFEAFSLHKYDASCYHHIDNNFGPDSRGDLELTKHETDDPSTWHWSAADKLFLTFIREAHQRGIKVILDGVFNHTGTRFFAFQDVLKNQQRSRYADWYDVVSWRDSTKPGSKFEYHSWWNTQTLPEFKEDEHSFAKPVWDYIFNITRRWMDPNGDGDPSDGIDGWRLDVPNDVSHVFWKKWRVLVKSINPNAYIVGEIWDDASAWLQGDEFDAVMNYRFAKACVRYFINTDTSQYSASQFDTELAGIRASYPPDVDDVMQNLFDSHDTDRLLSMIVNPNRNYNDANRLQNNAWYNVSRPGDEARRVMKLMVLFQMTYIGAPMVYYGDEAGMWGAGDPDDRKPMVWPDLQYENEATHPIAGMTRTDDVVKFDSGLFDYYRNVIRVRNENPALRRGTFKTLLTDNTNRLYAFQRELKGNVVLVILNSGSQTQSVRLPSGEGTSYVDVLNGNALLSTREGALSVAVQGVSGRILVERK